VTATQVGYGDEGLRLCDLQSQGDRIPGAFFRMKSGVTREGKRRTKGKKSVVLSQDYSRLAILTRNSAGMLEGEFRISEFEFRLFARQEFRILNSQSEIPNSQYPL
jgi:hypothetical protein